MITNNEHQAAWVAHLKSVPATISPVAVAEVREDEWKGTAFSYPNIRVKSNLIIPTPDAACGADTGYVTILVFTEDKSSKIADTIAGAIANYYHGRHFTSQGVKISAIVESLVAAEAESETVWKSSVALKTLLS